MNVGEKGVAAPASCTLAVPYFPRLRSCPCRERPVSPHLATNHQQFIPRSCVTHEVGRMIPWRLRNTAMMVKLVVDVKATCQTCGPMERAEQRTRTYIL